jgi:hypothetical protein
MWKVFRGRGLEINAVEREGIRFGASEFLVHARRGIHVIGFLSVNPRIFDEVILHRVQLDQVLGLHLCDHEKIGINLLGHPRADVQLPSRESKWTAKDDK